MKKLNKFFAVLVALAMMATLCVSMAFAELSPEQDATKTSKANIVKYLQIPEGVTASAAFGDYEFTLTPYAVSSSSLEVADMPTFNDQKITINASSKQTAVSDDGQSVYGILPLTFLDSATWKGAGVYTYLVNEKEGNIAGVEYDDGMYAINVYVENGEEGGYTVSHITAQKAHEEEVLNDDGEVIPGETKIVIENGKEKVTTTDPVVIDPTKTTIEVIEEEEVPTYYYKEGTDGSIETEGVTFTNTYTKSSTGDQKYGALSIEKTVDADTPDNNAEFLFELTITAPTGHEGETFKATVWDANGKVNTAEEDEDPAYIVKTFKDGEATTFNLKNGQYLKFETSELYAGTKYTVKEKLASSDVNKKDMYSPSYELYTADTDTVTTGKKTGKAQAGQDLAIEVTPLIKEASTKELADYTNTFDDELNTPTGILISNLPYIALALVAIGGLVAYVVIRRKADDEA